jgi:hypothetical protein
MNNEGSGKDSMRRRFEGRVAVSDIDNGGIEAVVAGIRAAGSEASGVRCDVAARADVDELRSEMTL